jgi:hypothetical protein
MVNLLKRPIRSSKLTKLIGYLLIVCGILISNPWSLIVVYLDTADVSYITYMFLGGVLINILGITIASKHKIQQ